MSASASGTITVSLSMASADVALVAPGRDIDARPALISLAREAIRLSVDSEPLRPSMKRRRLMLSAGGSA